MQLGFYFDQTRCNNCLTCVIACKDWHDIPEGPVFWKQVMVLEEGTYPDVSVSFLAVSCYHCGAAPCISECPADAIRKRKDDGIVMVDSEACLGKESCGVCRDACPYGVPQFGMEPDAKMQKCNLCLDRWEEGKKPVCVESCPVHALDAGPMERLESEYGSSRRAKGHPDCDECQPSVLFKSKG